MIDKTSLKWYFSLRAHVWGVALCCSYKLELFSGFYVRQCISYNTIKGSTTWATCSSSISHLCMHAEKKGSLYGSMPSSKTLDFEFFYIWLKNRFHRWLCRDISSKLDPMSICFDNFFLSTVTRLISLTYEIYVHLVTWFIIT